MSDRPDSSENGALDELRDELGDQFAGAAAGQQRSTRRGLRPGLVAVIALTAFVPGAVALAGGFNGAAKTRTIEVSGSRVVVDGRVVDCPASFEELKKLSKDPCDPARVPHLVSVSPRRLVKASPRLRKINCPVDRGTLDALGRNPCRGLARRPPPLARRAPLVDPDSRALVPAAPSRSRRLKPASRATAQAPLFKTVRAAPPALSPASPCPEWVKEFLRSAKYGETKFSDYDELPGYPFKDCPTARQLSSAFSLSERDAASRPTRTR